MAANFSSKGVYWALSFAVVALCLSVVTKADVQCTSLDGLDVDIAVANSIINQLAQIPNDCVQTCTACTIMLEIDSVVAIGICGDNGFSMKCSDAANNLKSIVSACQALAGHAIQGVWAQGGDSHNSLVIGKPVPNQLGCY